jgi:hypothetical protein
MPDERLDVVPDHCLQTSARAEKHASPLAVPITGWVAAPAAGLNAAAGEVVVLRGYPTHAIASAPFADGVGRRVNDVCLGAPRLLAQDCALVAGVPAPLPSAHSGEAAGDRRAPFRWSKRVSARLSRPMLCPA